MQKDLYVPEMKISTKFISVKVSERINIARSVAFHCKSSRCYKHVFLIIKFWDFSLWDVTQIVFMIIGPPMVYKFIASIAMLLVSKLMNKFSQL